MCSWKHNQKFKSMVTVEGKQGSSRNRQQAERRIGRCFSSTRNKRLLSCSCQLQSVTCSLYLKQDMFTSRGACRRSEDCLSSGKTCYWLTCMLLTWLTATMIIATPQCQWGPWSEGSTFYRCLSIIYPFFPQQVCRRTSSLLAAKGFLTDHVRAHLKVNRNSARTCFCAN